MSLKVSTLLTQLSGPESEVRLLAIKRLGMIFDDESIIKPLLGLLIDKDPKIREAAILSLSVQPTSEEIIKPILNTLNDEDEDVQLAAIKTLSEFRSALALKPLIKLLTDPNRNIRSSSVLGLGTLEDKNALFPLIECLEDEDIQVRVNTLAALSNIGDPRAIDPIIDLLGKESDEAVKQMAILTLGKIGATEERIIPPLIKLLDSKNPRERQYAVNSLGLTKSTQIIEYLIKLLNDEDAYVRRACATALSEIKDPTTVKQFIERLKDPNAEIRETAARALGKLGDLIAVSGLIEALHDGVAAVREEAAKSLGELQNPQSTKHLIQLLRTETNLEVILEITRAIGRIEGNSGTMLALPLMNPVVRVLTKLLDVKELSIRAAAAESLAKIYLNEKKYAKARIFYERASKESLTWEFRQPFYTASALGCGILERLTKRSYINSDADFEEIYDNLSTAAKMLGNRTFISKSYWEVLELFNNIFQSKTKGQFVQMFRDLGLKALLLEKKIPDDYRPLIGIVIDRLNDRLNQINKRGLSLEENFGEMEKLFEDLEKLGKIILQIEPLEMRADEDQQGTISALEDLTASTTPSETDTGYLREETTLIQRATKSVSENKKNFLLEETVLDTDLSVFAGQTVNIALIQYLKGAPRESFIEDFRSMWDKYIKRYYDPEVFHGSRIVQFTQESVQMRAKPKIIGYLDDAIFENSKLIIFPEWSMPESYIPKLQQFADRFNIFIIAGIESIAPKEKGKFANRAYVISPLTDRMVFQNKNSPTIFAATERYVEEWRENTDSITPPLFKLFSSPFGRFIILIGVDYKLYGMYIPFIAQNKDLDFIIVLNAGFENEKSLTEYQTFANDVKRPILFVNSGLYGGTNVYLPKQSQMNRNSLQNEYTEGIFNWKWQVPTKFKMYGRSIVDDHL